MKTLNITLLASLALLMTGCAADMPAVPATDAEEAGDYVYNLSLTLEPQSRADQENAAFTEGDITYFSFRLGNGTTIGGWAEFLSRTSWELHTSVPIGSNTYGKVQVAYFGPECKSKVTGSLDLPTSYPIYLSDEVDYFMHDKVMEITATLKPQGFRFRLKSTYDTSKRRVQGLSCWTSWNPETGGLVSAPFTEFTFNGIKEDDYYYYTPYSTVSLINYNPDYTNFESFKVISSSTIYVFPQANYPDMFKWGNTSTLNMDSRGGYSLITHAFSNTYLFESVYTDLSVHNYDYYRFYTGGFHIKGKVKVLELYGDPSTQKLYVMGSSGRYAYSDVYCKHNLLADRDIQLGETFDFDWSFCDPNLVGSTEWIYINLGFSNVKFEISNVSVSNF